MKIKKAKQLVKAYEQAESYGESEPIRHRKFLQFVHSLLDLVQRKRKKKQ